MVKCLIAFWTLDQKVSTISESFYEEHLSNLELSDTRNFLKLVAANNLQIPYLGYLEVDVEIFGCTFTNVGFLVSKSKHHCGHHRWYFGMQHLKPYSQLYQRRKC